MTEPRTTTRVLVVEDDRAIAELRQDLVEEFAAIVESGGFETFRREHRPAG